MGRTDLATSTECEIRAQIPPFLSLSLPSSLFFLLHTPSLTSLNSALAIVLEGRPTRPTMAPAPSRAIVALSLFLASTLSLTSAQDSSLGVVDPAFPSNDLSDGLFEYDITEYDDEDDTLPSPFPADYEQLSEDEFSQVFKRTVDGQEQA